MEKKAYLIKNIEQFGKFIAFCIEHDINVWRTYWDEREKEDRCYQIDWNLKKCFYCSRKYWEKEGFEIIEPKFNLNKFGEYEIKD